MQGQGHVKIEPPEGGLEVDPQRGQVQEVEKKNEGHNLLVIPVVLLCLSSTSLIRRK